MNKIFFLSLFLLVLSCTDNPTNENCTEENCTKVNMECKENQCQLKDGFCEKNSDCVDSICDSTTFKCVKNTLNCENDKHEENGICESNRKQVSCKDITVPANGEQVEIQVEITWSDGTWSEPTDCEFKCLTDYHKDNNLCVKNTLNCENDKHEENGICESNSKQVSCKDITVPANGEQVEIQVEITWSDGTWSEPTDCTWRCLEEYYQEENQCIKNGECSVDQFSNPLNDSKANAALITPGKYNNLTMQNKSCEKVYEYYKIDLEANKKIKVKVTPENGDISILILNPSGTYLASSDLVLNHIISTSGRYYIVLERYTDRVKYNMDISVTDTVCDEVDIFSNPLNDSFETATLIEAGTYTNLTTRDSSCNLVNDWYKINVASNKKLHIDLTFIDENGDIDLWLRNSNDEFLDLSVTSTDNETLDYNVVNSGLYYINIFNHDRINSYSMNIEIRDNFVNECLDNSLNNCSQYATCINTENSFSCSCKAGFIGDGVTCTDINECTDNSNNCDTNAICHNEIGSFSCSCKAGFIGDGITCTDINECTNNSNNCDTNATCYNEIGSFSCSCNIGFSGDGTICTDDSLCNDGCGTNAHCNNGTCTCNLGYTGNANINCSDINECINNNCQNESECIDEIGTYSCTCQVGYDGRYCETNINDCNSSLCQNGGKCIDGVNSYTCTCLNGYEGINCEINIDDCTNNNCQNGSTCLDGVNSYDCKCLTGFTGQYCEIDVDNCASNPCQNGSTCIDGEGNAYACTCQTGYEGVNCEIDIDDCASNPCLNGSTCLDGVNTYTCICQAGYEGVNCEIDIDDCSPNPCQNGSTCTDGVNSYNCECIDGYFGNNCENQVYQWGISSGDYGKVIVADTSGNIYVATKQPTKMILTKFSNSYTQIWTREWNGIGSAIDDMKIDGSNIYVVGSYDYGGHESRGFLKRLSLNTGTEDYSRLFISDSVANALTIHDNYIYITGSIEHDGDTKDSFIKKYSMGGIEFWTEYIGGFALDEGEEIGIDSSGNIYVLGWTTSNSFYPGANGSGGDRDCFIVKYDSNRTIKWVRRFNSDTSDKATGLVVDSNDNIYITMNINKRTPLLKKLNSMNIILEEKILGNAEEVKSIFMIDDVIYLTGWGNSDFSKKDTFLAKFSDGSFQTNSYLGTSEDDVGNDIFINDNNIYITGSTYGEFPDYSSAGGMDSFIIKIKK